MSGECAWDAVIDTPIGRVAMRLDGERVAEIEPWLGEGVVERAPTTAAARRAVAALERYLVDPCKVIEIDFALRGTPFQRRVWEAMRAIPPGETRTYGELARELKSSPRAVGGACRANPVPLLIPCHRVVAANGLGGYAGDTGGGDRLILKRRLLALEGVVV